MSIKEFLSNFLFYFAVGALIMVPVQYFMGNRDTKQDALKSGQEYIVSTVEAAQKPLQREVELEKPFHGQIVKASVETGSYSAVFSNYAGSLDALNFKRIRNEEETSIATIGHTAADIKEAPAFLVALGEKTPVDYVLIEQVDSEENTVFVYKADGLLATITKKFTLSKLKHTINLTLTVHPKNNNSVQPRIFIPQPFVQEMGERNMAMALVNTPKRAIEKRKPESVVDRSWIKPELFGSENRYFIHALIHDAQHFSQRGYFTLEPNGMLAAILEGPVIDREATWSLDFYCGPKTVKAMALADGRLESTLDYGWFSVLARFFTYLLNVMYASVHNYGLAIVLLTCALTLALMPFTGNSTKNRRKSVELRQKMAYVEQRYKDDPQAIAREKAELIKKYGMPEMAGCLPLLVQLPIFIGLQRALASSFELYQAPFFGWITDLSVRDPYCILPLIAALGMIVRTASAGGPRQRLQAVLIAIILGTVFSNLAAGLVLYICVSTWLGILQTFIEKARRA